MTAAGSKARKPKGLGIALFEALKGDDPNNSIGLPPIRLIGLLAEAGIDPPTSTAAA